MVSHNFEDRPSIDDILIHPFLWSNTKRVMYLTDVGNKIDQHKELLEDVCWSCEGDVEAKTVEPRIHILQMDISSQDRRWVCACKGSGQRSPWRKTVHENLMLSLTRRRKYPSDSTAWFIRFFRNLDQHFHDQTDEGLLCLKGHSSPGNAILNDADFLVNIRSSSSKQREVIGNYISTLFPSFFLSVWLNVGPIEI